MINLKGMIVVLALITIFNINAFCVSDNILVNFSEIDEALSNPYMGWVDYSGNNNRYVGGNLVFARASWKDLERDEKGKYLFNEFEERINYKELVEKGYKFIFLLYLDWPDQEYNRKDLPYWLYDEIGTVGTYYKNTATGSYGFSPDYSNEAIIKGHRLLIENFAKRYDNENTYIMSIGSVGHWGELHTTFIRDRSKVGSYPTKDIESKYLEPYGEYFKNTYLSLRRPRDAGVKYSMGLHNHGLGNSKQTYNWYLDFYKNGYVDDITNEKRPAMPEFWKYAPSGAEFFSWPYTDYMTDATIEETLRQVKDTNVSWIMSPPNSAVENNTTIMKNMDRILRVMGYRLYLKEAQYNTNINKGQSINLSLLWENTGVSPCYFNWPMEISLKSNNTIIQKELFDVDLKKWLPGEISKNVSIIIPQDIEEGTYDICVSFINPLDSKPGVKLAFETENENMRYTIGKVTIIDNSPQIIFDDSESFFPSEEKIDDYTDSIIDSNSDDNGSSDNIDTEANEKETVNNIDINIENEKEMLLTDVNESYWASNYIKELYVKGILEGYDDLTYRPDNNITRAEFVILMYRTLNLSNTDGEISFTDVKKSAYYYNSLKQAFNNGLIEGYPDGTFKPDGYISRQDIAVIISRAINDNTISDSFNDLTYFDKFKIGQYARSAVAKVYNAGIMTGRPNEKFEPNEFATRGEISAIIYRLLQNKF